MEFSWKRNLFVLWVGVFFCSTAYSISIPFLPIFLHTSLGVHEHLEAWSGISFGITFLASALISPYWGSLADKYGRKPMLIRSGFSLALLYFLTYFITDPYLFLVLRVFQGLLAGYVPAAIALVATNTPEKNVGYALGVMATSGATGGIVGPLVGGVVSHLWGNAEAFLFSGCVVLVAALIATFLVKETNMNRSGSRSNVREDLRAAIANRSLMTILGLSLMVTISVMLLEPLLTVYVLQLGASQQEASLSAGIIFAAVGIATVIAAPQWGKLGGKVGYTKILFIGLLGGAFGNLLQFFFTNLYGFGVLRFAYGLFFAAVYPSINAMIVKVTEPEFRGRAFSLNQSANQLATMLGPVLGGVLGGAIPIRYVFIINGIALLATAILIRSKKPGLAGKQAQQQSSDPQLAAK
ncbi:MFS transporter [Brevibacillus agri]|uniref:MFS transporter n=3 Tax=Brevibacillus agri TaxID=51101 RepID=A0A3M8AA39_9BACL|nr:MULTISPECIES: MFS transporter [Brevibacillus]EJL42903.1 arabinose efflux permease family protein [Brevibacillus sp. CF112]MBG9564571.1 MFS transporter [Brevibacillus agri]MBY0051705.1 MFS transporter [Brevibacillus agri]MCG5252167.1 MFS transporter [Brevibacillus agri]MDN4091257.1 MFS transporter [Brevibacillus agri]